MSQCLQFAISDSWNAGWQSFKNHWGSSLIFLILSWILLAGSAYLLSLIHPSLGVLAVLLLVPLFLPAYNSVHLQYKSGKQISLKSFFSHYTLSFFFNYWAGAILITFIYSLGFLLLIIPGIYLSFRLSLFLPALLDHPEEGFLGAMKKSWNMTKGSVCHLFGFWLASLLLYILTAFTIIGLFITPFVLSFAVADIYYTNRQGQQQGSPKVGSTNAPPGYA